MFVCENTESGHEKLHDLEKRLESYYSGLSSHDYFMTAQGANEDWGKNSSHLILLDLLKDGDSIIDMGCGTGVVAQKLKQKKIKYVGVDWSYTALEMARKSMSETANHSIDASFQRASIYDTEFQNQSFDVVTTLFVIEHLTRPRDFITEAMRLVRSGGTLFILCPDYRRFGRMPSLPLGGNNSLKNKIRRVQIVPTVNHLWRAMYWKIKIRFLGAWAVWTEPACFHGLWRPDADAVYLASRKEILKELIKAGFRDKTDYWVSRSSVKPSPIDCLIVAQKD